MEIVSDKMNLQYEIPLYKNKNVSIKERVSDLLSRMTIQEKCGQLNMIRGGKSKELNSSEFQMKLDKVMNGDIGFMIWVLTEKDILELQNAAIAESRLGIPIIFAMDVCHGMNTLFPIPLAEACSWDIPLIENCYSVMAKETAAMGIHMTFGPGCDMSFDPRWGRIMEGSGEDVYLTSQITASRVKGFQKNLETQEGVVTCMKHFVGYGAVEGGREYNKVDISRLSLWNVHLPPFEAAIEAGVKSVMSAYTTFEGIPSSANEFLLKELLIKKLKFEGLIISDCMNFSEIFTQGFTESEIESTKIAMNAGSMIDMQSGYIIKYLPELVLQGNVTGSVLDEAVKKVLQMKFQLGLFDDPFKFHKNISDCFPSHKQMSRELAEKSILLLKNERNTLPLMDPKRKVLLVGNLADSPDDMYDMWKALADPKMATTLKQGLESKFPNVHFCRGYDQYYETNDSFMVECETQADECDVIIINLGISGIFSGEDTSLTNLEIPAAQVHLLKRLRLKNKPIIVVVSAGRPLILSSILEHCDSLIYGWILGCESGAALANIITGQCNPSAKTVISFPQCSGQIPITYSQIKTGKPSKDQSFTLHDRQRLFCSRYRDSSISPLFPFGFGLSYTNFKYMNLITSGFISEKEPANISISISNIGNFDGEEITQLYVEVLQSKIIRPTLELKRFAKTFIKKETMVTLHFQLEKKDLGFRDSLGNFILPTGDFIVKIGGCSNSLLETKLIII